MAQDRHAWLHEMVDRRPPRRVESDTRLVLLGTAGGSSARSTRCGFANALVVGDVAYLVDCGEGVQTQLHRAGVVATRRFGGGGGRPVVETIFLTHLHADHIMDLVNIFQGSWPSSRIDVYGPGPAGPPFTTHDDPVHPVRFPDDPAPGVRRVIEHLNRAFAMNINARIIAERRNDYLDHIHIHEIGLAGEVGGEPGDIEVAVEIERGGALLRDSAGRSVRRAPAGRARRHRHGDASCSTPRCSRRWPTGSTRRPDRWCSPATPAPATTSSRSPPGPTSSCTR